MPPTRRGLGAARSGARLSRRRRTLPPAARETPARGQRSSTSRRPLWAVARPARAIVIVNDRADIARLAGADGVHVGQDDLSPAAARAMLGPDAIVGLSTHTVTQIEAAATEPVDYVAIGPCSARRRRRRVIGRRAGRWSLARRAAARPVVAIGGITLDNAASVIAAGAASVAVISDLLVTGDPAGRTAEYPRRACQQCGG